MLKAFPRPLQSLHQWMLKTKYLFVMHDASIKYVGHLKREKERERKREREREREIERNQRKNHV
jgi:hypothetical protein